MSKKFYSGYDAAVCAAAITNEWRSESDELLTPDALLTMMQVADEEGGLDEDDPQCYYVVSDDGAVGFTSDAEKMILWIARPTRAPQPRQQARFCAECGAPLAADAKFCTGCGASAEASARKLRPPKPEPPRPHGPVGYSPLINDPQFLAATKKHRKSNRGCAAIFILVPFVAMTLYSIFSKELEVIYGMFIGGAVSALFLVFALLSSLGSLFQKSWEGVVEKKYTKEVRRHNKRDNLHDYYDEPHGILVVRSPDGKKHKIDERLDVDAATSYHYFKVGDRLMYHAKLGLPYPYEKFDKSKDEFVICAFCRRRAPIVNTHCERCGNPLLK